MKPKHPILSLGVLSGLALFTGSTTLQAQTAWDGGGGNTDYSNNLNWAGDIIPGDGNANGASIGSSSNQTVIYNTATSYTSTGVAQANSLIVGSGTNGVGSLTLSGSAGTLTFGGDAYSSAAWIGAAFTAGNNATGSVTVSAGKLAIGGTGSSDASINLGVSLDATTGVKSGTLVISGGTVDVGRRILMGANQTTSVGLLTISSGTLDMKRTGSNAEGDLGMIRFGTGNNTVNLDGGTVIFSGFHTSGAASARSTIFMNGTTLKANANITDLFNGTTASSTLQLKNGGLVVDTNTFNVTINDALTQVAGNVALLRKEGAGTLTITGAQANRTGTTTINGGTLRVSGTGSLGTGATTVNGSGSVLDLDRNDTWGGHAVSAQSLTIQAGGLVTNGSLINRGFNQLQTLALDGGELRVTGTARALVDGALYKFEAYGIRDSVTVTGSTASSITNPTAITNAGINIGGSTDLGGGVGSNVAFVVADVTNSSAADLTVSAVLKNNYDSATFARLSNGLVKSGGGTMVLSAVNTYTGTTTISDGNLVINGNISTSILTTVTSGATIGGSGTVGALTVNTGGFVTPGNSPGMLAVNGAYNQAGEYTVEITGTTAGSDYDQIAVNGTVDITGGSLVTTFSGAGYAMGDLLFILTNDSTDAIASTYAGYAQGAVVASYGGFDWQISYVADSTGNTFTGGNDIALTAIPESRAALLGGLGLLALLRRRRSLPSDFKPEEA